MGLVAQLEWIQRVAGQIEGRQLRRTSPWPVLLLAFGIAAAPPSTRAAERVEDSKRPGRYKVGPVYLTPSVELRRAGVDTNVNAVQARAIPDASLAVRPALAGALHVGRRLRLTGDGYLDLNYYRRLQTERSTDFGGEGRAELDLGSFTLFGGGGGLQAKQRFSIDFDQRILHQQKWAVAGVEVGLTRRLSATLSGTGRIHRFGDTLAGDGSVNEALDRNEFTTGVQGRFALTRQTGFLASAEGIEDRFLRPSGAGPRQVRSFRYLGGLDFGRRAIVNGKVLAGLREFPGTRGGAPAYRGPALAVSASAPLARFGRLVLEVERDVFYSAVLVETPVDRLRNSYVSNRFRAQASVGLPFDLIGRGWFGLERARYLLPYRQGDAFLRRVDVLWSSGGAVLRLFGDSTRVGVAVDWTRHLSNVPGAPYDALRYGLQAQFTP